MALVMLAPFRALTKRTISITRGGGVLGGGGGGSSFGGELGGHSPATAGAAMPAAAASSEMGEQLHTHRFNTNRFEYVCIYAHTFMYMFTYARVATPYVSIHVDSPLHYLYTQIQVNNLYIRIHIYDSLLQELYTRMHIHDYCQYSHACCCCPI